VLVYPGVYTGASNANVTWKSYVSLKGVIRDSTIIKGHITDESAYALINFANLVGVEVSNITLDGTEQAATYDHNQNGAVFVNGADINFTNVVFRTTEASWSNGFALSSTHALSDTTSRTGTATLKGCLIYGGVYVGDGNWTIEDTTVSSISDNGPFYVYGIGIVPGAYPGDLRIQNSRIEARALAYGANDIGTIWASSESSLSVTVIASTLVADGNAAESAPIYKVEGDQTAITVDNSVLVNTAPESEGANYHGLYVESDQGGKTIVRNSAFSAIGTGGVRTDVDNESAQGDVVIAGCTHSSDSDSGNTSTADSRQGAFSTDLVVPLVSPSLGPVNGQLWVDTVNNRLCYRSGGSTRCVTGS
jgi:hypothetical protein